jgi:hypothetical protein
MTPKPLSPHAAKALIDAFKTNAKDLAIHSVKELTESQRRALLQADHVWIVVGKSKWS